MEKEALAKGVCFKLLMRGGGGEVCTFSGRL